MSRFYRNEGLVIDLNSVTCVYGESVVVDGVLMKFSEAIAFDIRKQFCAFKEDRDKSNFDFKRVMVSRLYNLSWAAGLFGARLHQIGLLNAERHQKRIEADGAVSSQ